MGNAIGTSRTAKEVMPLLEYAGPLFVVVVCRFLGICGMSLAAAALGTRELAAYQVLVNLLLLFGLFGEPLSQTAQATLPPLLDKGPVGRDTALRAFRNLVALGVVAGAVMGLGAGSAALIGCWLFTTDPMVISIVRSAAPVLFLAVFSLIVAYPIDGAMLAVKDFNFLIVQSVFGTCIQLPMLWLLTLAHQAGRVSSSRGVLLVFLTFVIRISILETFSLLRMLRNSPRSSQMPCSLDEHGERGSAGC